MARFTSLTIAAAAVVVGVHSGSLTLALAALCGAGGVASFANEVVSGQEVGARNLDKVHRN